MDVHLPNLTLAYAVVPLMTFRRRLLRSRSSPRGQFVKGSFIGCGQVQRWILRGGPRPCPPRTLPSCGCPASLGRGCATSEFESSSCPSRHFSAPSSLISLNHHLAPHGPPAFPARGTQPPTSFDQSSHLLLDRFTYVSEHVVKQRALHLLLSSKLQRNSARLAHLRGPKHADR